MMLIIPRRAAGGNAWPSILLDAQLYSAYSESGPAWPHRGGRLERDNAMRHFRLWIAWGLGLAVLAGGLAGCDAPGFGGPAPAATATPATDLDRARAALIAFFDALAAGRYTDAARLYGGDYEVLSAANPDVGAEEHAKLWERACTANGFQCLKVKDVAQAETAAPGEFRFTVQFQRSDGALFTLEREVAGTPQPGISHFPISVERSVDTFLVRDLPLRAP
jgi:hypothetical protein